MKKGSLPPGFEGYETIGVAELGQILGRSTKSIAQDASRKPETLPPRFIVPGSRLARWRKGDVLAWMDALAELVREKRAKETDFARRFPASGYRGSSPQPGLVSSKSFALANERLAREAIKHSAGETNTTAPIDEQALQSFKRRGQHDDV